MTSDQRPSDVPEIVGGRYQVIGEIGRGGMGRVLKVTHIHTGETLALKLLVPPARGNQGSALERFRREARSLAQVRGDHVVRVIDADLAPELGGAPYLVMEYLEGEDLNDLLARRGRLSPAEVVPLLWQVALGLVRVHRAGLVHRDLKPANIFLHRVDQRTIVKLLDFGLVRPVGPPPDEAQGAVTGLREVVGTPLFMSPEQVHASPDAIGTATDIWATGVIAYYLLTGEPYWNLREMPRGMFDIGAAPLTPPSLLDPSLTVAFDAWFLRSCSRNPAARWPDPLVQVQELAAALGVPLDGATQVTLRETPAPAGEDETVASQAWGPSSVAPGQSAAEAAARQRRQVTVLFYRLAHTGEAGREMDPEEFETSEARLHGQLDQALGDLRQTSHQLARGGRFVFFGYPVAYGSDARRAAEAALRLVARAREIDADLCASGRGLQVRVGIHTGMVLAGPSAEMPGAADLVGQALGVATDLEHTAAPGQVIVSDATWRLLGGRFEGQALGNGRHLVTGTSGAGSSGQAPGLPLVGRQAELAILQSCLQDARGGESQAVLISGEVGIGKSRLVHALRTSPEAADVRWLDCQASPYFQRTPFHPLTELMHRIVAESTGKPVDGLSVADVATMVQAIGLGSDVAESLEFVLSLPGADRSVLAALSPQLRRQRAIQALTALVQQLSIAAPVVLVVEDLHWSDPSTLEWLDQLSVLRAGRVLTVLTARPDFVPAWSAPSAVTPLQLRRLGRAQTAELIAHAARRPLPAHIAELVARTTDGIPLFIEEVARLVGERPDAPAGTLVSAMEVPTSLSEALGARLDRLGSARRIAEFASVIGTTFNAEDVQSLAGDDRGLPGKLQELVRAKVIQPLGLPPHTAYAFQHALLREAAYGSLPRDARRHLHLLAAQTLAGRADVLPEVLAHHFEEGGRPIEAAGLLLQAGQHALARSANAEARAHFQRGIDVLERHERTATPADLPVDPALDITLRTMYGMAWVVSKGYAAPEGAAAFSAAMGRVQALGDTDVPGTVPALWANWVYLFVTGRMADAARQAARLRRSADRSGDNGAAMMADLAEGTVLFDQARYAEAVAHLDAALQRYDPQEHGTYRYLYGQDPWMYGTVFKAWALWCVGSADAALHSVEAAVAHAAGLQHANSLGFALAIAALVRQYRGELDALGEHVATLTQLSAEQGWVQWRGFAQLLSGAAEVMKGETEAGVRLMREARAIGRTLGDKAGSTHYDALLVDGLCRAGLLDEAADVLAGARADVTSTGERAFEAELLRLEGEVARLRGLDDQARHAFEAALENASASGACAYALRAALSLLHLARTTGQDDTAAADAVRAVLDELVEGETTADVRAARAAIGTPGGAASS
jgi:predicted ATPase/class 3 adenylate cyclase